MAWLRFLLYFLVLTLVVWWLTQLEIDYPGSLRLQEFTEPSDALGTSEYSPIEMMQSVILVVGGLLMAWVAWTHVSQRPLAFPFGGVALAFLIAELDFFLDRLVAHNFWQVLIGIAGALVIAYTYRQRLRLRIALARIWPSPGMALMFAGAIILFGFVRLVGHEPLWQALLGDGYQRIAMLAVEEFVELLGYYLWLIGAIEYCYQTANIAVRDPLPAAVRRRQTKLGRRR